LCIPTSSHLVDLVTAIEKIEETCLMLLTPKKVQFILISDVTGDVFQVWAACNSVCTISVIDLNFEESLLENYVIESQNSNEIAFNINLGNLLRGLKSGTHAQEIHMKLTKKGSTAYLSFAILMNV
jgi:hypothetical protein